MSLTAERLRELLDYDPETGFLHWKQPMGRWGRIPAGSVAGGHSRDGRMQIMIDGKNLQYSRVIWFHVTGQWPEGDVDHIDTDPGNSRWDNLRDVSHQTNTENKVRATKGNRSGYLGVTMHQGRFRADITVNKSRRYIGMFSTALEAHNAYLEVKRQCHKGCTI